MKITWYTEEDALYVRFGETSIASGQDLDDDRHLDKAKDGSLIGIEFLNISNGVNLDDIPEPFEHKLEPLLRERGIKVYA